MALNRYSLVVIGAGAGGLVVAIGAAKAGKKVLLVEKGHYGGDCTNFGCIPSKTLIASAEAAHLSHSAKELGFAEGMTLDPSDVLTRVRKTIESIRTHEEPEALEKMGVTTCTATVSFLDTRRLLLQKDDGTEETIGAKTIVIATGSSPFIPPMNGLKGTPYLTNETIFSLEKIPKTLAVIGAGPIGCELAQAFARLGSEVTIIKSERGLLPREEPDVQELMTERFAQEGIAMHVRCDANMISYANGQFHLCIKSEEAVKDVYAKEVLVSTGRRPNVSLLNLDKAGVTYSDKGIPVDAYGRTNQRHIYAIGDVVGGPLFTHLAENQGRSVLTSILLPGPLKSKLDRAQSNPRCTFTDPEIASVGLSEKEAEEKHGKNKLAIYTVPFADIDRAITSGKKEGFVKVITHKWSSKILGATIVGPRAGEMLPELSLALLHGIPLRQLRRLIHPYPTYNAAIRKAADLWLTQTVLPGLRTSLKRKKHD